MSVSHEINKNSTPMNINEFTVYYKGPARMKCENWTIDNLHKY